MQLVSLDVLSRRHFQLFEQQTLQLRAPPLPGMPWISPAIPEQSFAPTPLDCMDLLCLCPYLHVCYFKIPIKNSSFHFFQPDHVISCTYLRTHSFAKHSMCLANYPWRTGHRCSQQALQKKDEYRSKLL
ncbi:unnamed protein product [Gongylonema pulchrum]|uniref:Ovule protein n=1 Tax=Gongylonema pulchrum TaxID=637853 RepID=A0A183DGP9_9BILA|nr:unnamed protein product [Gongylonema pulchrum]